MLKVNLFNLLPLKPIYKIVEFVGMDSVDTMSTVSWILNKCRIQLLLRIETHCGQRTGF